ncbi:MAG: ABC transporter ATP-binding protein, partial [Lachnospiraceae bacterium]|nr:ABC transporter ATP-binding protein [Lachnospiraceae bacterium]
MKDEGTILQCVNLYKRYEDGGKQRDILKNVNLEIPAGSMNQICGKSGSGKTTLLNLLAGLDQASEGRLYFWGKEYAAQSEAELAKLRGECFGFVFQSFHLLQNISVQENIKSPAYVTGKKIDLEYMGYLVEMLGLKELLNQTTCKLSGGEQQRAAIARAMLLKPQIIFADEPTGNLDTANTEQIVSLFRKIHQTQGTTFVVVTHEEGLLKPFAKQLRIK